MIRGFRSGQQARRLRDLEKATRRNVVRRALAGETRNIERQSIAIRQVTATDDDYIRTGRQRASFRLDSVPIRSPER